MLESHPEARGELDSDTGCAGDEVKTLVIRLLFMVFGLLAAALTGMVYFLSAGRWDLWFGWAVTGVFAVISMAGMALTDPDLLRERRRPGPGALDRSLLNRSRLLALATLVIAGLDVGRFHWSDTVPRFLQIVTLALLGFGLTLAIWAMAVNRFFSSVIRLQKERAII